MAKTICRVAGFVVVVLSACTRDDVSRYHLIPFPEYISSRAGTFVLSAATAIALSDPADGELQSLGAFGADVLAGTLGSAPDIAAEPFSGQSNTIGLVLVTDPRAASGERYQLRVTEETITISASEPSGLFYGLQTLRQLVPHHIAPSPDGDGETVWPIPAVEIDDGPRFTYRGMHLDVGRHLFPVDFIKKYIDLLAMYKMNTFHWHLTEDQGWRIEIQKYPRLAEVGAFRRETILEKNFNPFIGDGIPYGGFYTQDEVREIVAYARARYVTVIPEIEMPGHSLGALAAYPEFACTEGPFNVATRWGVHPDIYCPTEETFAFLEDVLTEVMDLFPSRYIHIGGDEAPKTRWEASPVAQTVIRREGLADEHELQSYFIRRIERFLLSHDRRLIGWDEILEGGLAPEATVMSWRGMSGGIAAAKQGHDVIMTPTSHMYFDYYQGDPEHEPLAIGGYTPLDKVYGFEPVPEELTDEEATHILGTQANLWTEYIKTTGYLEYMAYPRALALAEVAWTDRRWRDWESFTTRLQTHYRRLSDLAVNYRIPHVEGLDADVMTLADRVVVPLRASMAGAEIRYTTDGSDPTSTSPLYQGPLDLPVDEAGVTVTARAFGADGRSSAAAAAHFHQTVLRPPVALDAPDLERGARFAYYEDQFSTVDGLSGATPAREGVVSGIELSGFEREEFIGLSFAGHLRVPASDIYTFYLTSDDGSRLTIGDTVVIDHDGSHGATERTGAVALEAGYHPINIRFFHGRGPGALHLTVRRDGDARPASIKAWLFHERLQSR